MTKFQFAWTLALGAITLLGWIALATRLATKRQLLIAEPRRAVPWNVAHLLLIVVMVFGMEVVAFQVASLVRGQLPEAQDEPPELAANSDDHPASPVLPDEPWIHDDSSPETPSGNGDESASGAGDNSNSTAAANDKRIAVHPLARLLAAPPYPWTIWICAAIALVVAPVLEELIFRVALQGWLEKLASRSPWEAASSPSSPFACEWLAPPLGLRGLLPVVTSSLIFGVVHVNFAGESDLSLLDLHWGMVAHGLASLIAIPLALAILITSGGTGGDLGFRRLVWREEIPLSETSTPTLIIQRQIWIGIAAFGVAAAPIYGIQFALRAILPEWIAPDPFAIFFFAMALGYLYTRTRRVLPCIVTHVLLNAFSFAIALTEA